MKFLVYCPLNGDNIETSLGTADYSYYFVMRRFIPLLAEFGEVITLAEPPGDDVVAQHQRGGECVYLAFTPPDKAVGSGLCPIVPVFAWEYSTIPYESFRYPRDNWVEDLRATGRAITHSTFAAEVVREQLGRDYDIATIPAPLWDSCVGLREQRRLGSPKGLPGLVLDCTVIDSDNYDISNTAVRPKRGTEGELTGSAVWGGQALDYCFARGEFCPTLVGFNDAEPWGVWSRSGRPWLMLEQALQGEVEIEITVRGYAHNVGEWLGIELGDYVAYVVLSEALTTHLLRLEVETPSSFLAFSGVEKRAVGMDDPRDIGFGLARLQVRPVAPGTKPASQVELDFTAADGLLLEGFHGLEPPGRWTGAARCVVRLPEPIAGDLVVRIETFHILNNHRREIELWIGGASKKITLNEKRNTYEVSFSGVCPTDAIRFDNLGFGPSGSESDPRQLGLGISKIAIRVKPTPRRKAKRGLKTTENRMSREGSQVGGVLYTAILNPNDGRKNWEDIITAFVYALREKPGATLLVKIANQELRMFLEDIFTFFMRLHPFKCRILFVHGYLSDEEYQQLIVHSHYIVNASRGEGQCLPLMEFMSSGVPAIAPGNTAMLDYIDASNAFLVGSSPELAYWPHDPRQVYRTYWHRINWQSLYDAFVRSEAVVLEAPQQYRKLCDAAVDALERFCSLRVTRSRFSDFIDRIRDPG